MRTRRTASTCVRSLVQSRITCALPPAGELEGNRGSIAAIVGSTDAAHCPLTLVPYHVLWHYMQVGRLRAW